MRHHVKKQLALRVLSTAAVVTMVTSIATPAFADAYGIATYGTYYVDKGSVTVEVKDGKHYVTQTDGKGGYIYQNHEDTDNKVTLTSRDEESGETKTTHNTVSIDTDAGNTADITLDDLHIATEDYWDSSKKAPGIEIKGDGDVNIELNGNNSVLSGAWDTAGIEKADSKGKGTLTIKDDVNDDSSKKTGTETDITGKLFAGGHGEAAAIGGGSGQNLCDTSNIIITGGEITAIGGYDGGCAIGGGGRPGGTGKNISIEGNAHVTAAAAEGAAIGGSSTGGNSITIKDNAVVDAFGSWGSAIGDGGLGSGRNAPTTITISGNATVNAESNQSGCAIGSGQHGGSCDLTINIEDNANVTAIGSFDGPAIGNRYASGGTTTINITGGTVNAINSFGSDNYDNDGTGNSSPAIGAKSSTIIDKSGVYEGGTCNINIDSSTGNTVVNAYIYGKGSGPAVGTTKNTYSNITHSGQNEYFPAENADYNADGSSKLGESNSAIINCFRNAFVSKEKLELPVSKDLYAGNYHRYSHTIVGGDLYKVVHNRKYLDSIMDTSKLKDSDLHDWQLVDFVEPTLEADGYADYICSIDKCGQTLHVVLPQLTPEEPDDADAAETREVSVIFWDAANNAAAPEYLQGKTLNVEETSGAVSKAQADSVLADKEHWALAEDVGDLKIHPATDAAGTVYEQAVKASGCQYYVIANVTATH